MPTISVIVPVYNVEPYLCRCIDSILAQTFTDYELILVDDGSVDTCGRICDEYATFDKRVQVFHKNNGGVSAARNVGIKAAKGEYLIFCDSDDYWEKEWVKSLIDSNNSCNADLVSAGFSIIDKEEVIRVHKHVQDSFTFVSELEIVDFIIQHIFVGRLGWEVFTKLFQRDIVIKNDILFCETCENFAEDMGFVLEYLLYCKTVVMNDSFGYCYYQRGDSMMHVTNNKVKLNALNEVSLQFGKRFLSVFSERGRKGYLAVIHFLIMYNQYQRIVAKENYPQLPEEIRKIRSMSWYKKETKAALSSYPFFCNYFGKPVAQKIMLLSSYCLHRNWKLHTYLSALFYRYIFDGE